MYAVANLIDVLVRLQYMVRNIRDRAEGWWPSEVDGGMVPVLARVVVHNAIHEPAPGLTDLRFRGERIDFMELRGESAEIERMWVQDDLRPRPVAEALAGRLADAFGVPAGVGYPTFTRADVDAMPAWMLTDCQSGLPLRLDRPAADVAVDGAVVGQSMRPDDGEPIVWTRVNGPLDEFLAFAEEYLRRNPPVPRQGRELILSRGQRVSLAAFDYRKGTPGR